MTQVGQNKATMTPTVGMLMTPECSTVKIEEEVCQRRALASTRDILSQLTGMIATGVGACRVRDYTTPLTRIDAPLLADNKQQELTSIIFETPLPTRIALIGYTGQCDR